MEKKKADVAAALIRDQERFMICKRPANKARGGLWEFVGGKLEEGESPAQALVRECREELDCEVLPEEVFMEVDHDYPDLFVHLILMNARIVKGEPKLIEHQEIQWITPDEIENYEFCPADKEILSEIRRRAEEQD